MNGSAAEPVADPSAIGLDKSTGALQLKGGDIYHGHFASEPSTRDDGALIWKCPAFASELIVPWSSVIHLVQPFPDRFTPEDPQRSQDTFSIELQNGESVSGRITNISEQSLEIDSELLGKRVFKLEAIRCILRTSQPNTADEGIVSLKNWKQTIPVLKKDSRGKWFARLNSYETETAGTAVSQPVNFPDLSAIDINVSWEQVSPNWMLTVGDPRRLELHVRKLDNRNVISLTMLHEDDNSADIVSAQIPSDGLTSLSLRVLCDSNRGRMVLLHAGNPLGQIRLNKKMRLAGQQTVTFTNIAAGRVALRELKVYRSVFAAPAMKTNPNAKPGTEAESPLGIETLLRSGETFVGKPTGFELADQSFGFEDSNESLGRVNLSQVDRIEFPANPSIATDAVAKPLVAVELWSGARYVGQSVSRQASDLVLEMSQVPAPVRIPSSQVKSVGIHTMLANSEDNAVLPESDQLWMRLATPWAISLGRIEKVAPLLNDASQNPRPMLYWKPHHGLESVPLAPNATGTMEPILTLPPKKTASTGRISPAVPHPQRSIVRTLNAEEPSLFLTSGDCFPATISSMNNDELTFKSSFFTDGKIRSEWIRGIRIAVSQGVDMLDKGAKKRLLTLPRAQRNNPPKHLIVSREGDAVRGQLKELNEDIATLEVRGEDRTIRMKNVSEIVWLLDAPPIVPPGKKPPEPPKQIEQDTKPVEELRCQALYASGTRISILPEKFENGVLYGRHPQLGECHLELAKISRFVLGDEIVSEAQRNRFGKWKLENALDPKFVNDLDSPEGPSSDPEESPHAKLIGQSAPDFDLKKLDGTQMHLSDLKGQVVILDFWATWCGPCVASLPRMVELAQEYRGSEVSLVTVNIEQKPAEIQALLDRLDIKPTVAMDTDGSVAKSYLAEAIPQTVIIDRQGNVSHVIVGGGEGAEKKIRDILDALLDLKL